MNPTEARALETAVEAAAEALYNNPPRKYSDWPGSPEGYKDIYRREARVALVAGLPHLRLLIRYWKPSLLERILTRMACK